jgi:hypothetical protein
MLRGILSGLLATLLSGHAAVAADLAQWSRSGSNFTFQLRCEKDAEYLIQRSTNLLDWEPMRRSFGGATNRTIQCVISNEQSVFFRALRTNTPRVGMLAIGPVVFGGVPTFVDSYDSSDPRYSSNGLYTASTRKDTALVGSLSSFDPAVDTGSGKIYGSAVTGPGGTVAGNVGDAAWLTVNSGIQPGHVSSNLVLAITDVLVPDSLKFGSPLPTPVSNQWILTTGNYKSGALDVSTAKSIVISGPGQVRLYCTGDLTTRGSGYIKILPGASLQLYLGANATLSGNGLINETMSVTNCMILGLQTCTTLTYSGYSAFVGRVYATRAEFRALGTSELFGSFFANSILIKGPPAIHCDEAIYR